MAKADCIEGTLFSANIPCNLKQNMAIYFKAREYHELPILSSIVNLGIEEESLVAELEYLRENKCAFNTFSGVLRLRKCLGYSTAQSDHLVPVAAQASWCRTCSLPTSSG